ncbi:MAG: major facilitator superfamily 1 [Dehalococcoidales bacterium]|nr:major facilitator superfamily 1 [Dehalococcoidales bacterium]
MNNKTIDSHGVDIKPGRDKGIRERMTLGIIKTFSSFRSATFRLYFIGSAGQWSAMNMDMLARSLLVYRLTGSATILGVMSLVNAVPWLFVSLLGGVLADRVQKKYIMVASQTGSAIISLALAWMLTAGYVSPERPGSWWVLLVASVLQGGVMGLMLPSRQAIVAEIVSAEHIMNAVALNNLGMNTLRFLAPALTGFIIDHFGFAAVFYAMAGLSLTGAIFIAFLPLTSRISVRTSGTLGAIKEGFRYIRHEPAILVTIVFSLLAVVLAMPYMTLAPIFTEDILKVGATGLGILMSASGIGAMLVSLVLASLPNRKRGMMLIASGLVSGLALVVFSFSHSWPLSLASIIFVGLGQAAWLTLGNTLLQSYAKPAYLGRVMSIYMMQFGLQNVATFAAALLAEAAGAPASLGSLAIALVLLSVLTAIFVPRLRRLE